MAGRDFEKLVEIMARLRAPDGCPWDGEQTHESLKAYLIEEAYEVVDAIERGDMEHLKEELGDLLLQVVFHAQLASEAASFNIDDVLVEITDKLVRRHPHVFAGAQVSSSEDVVRRWEKIKEDEAKAWSRLSGVPASLPALLHAYKLQTKAARAGFDWDSREGVLEKLSEETREIREAVEGGAEVETEIGDLLFSIVNVSRWLGVDPEVGLKRVCRKFEERFRFMEAEAKRGRKDFEELSLEEKDRLWEEAKRAETRSKAKSRPKKTGEERRRT